MVKRRSSVARDTNEHDNGNPEKQSTTPTKRRRVSVASEDADSCKIQGSNSKGNSANEQLEVHELTGDIFDAPPNTVIVHACNCQGSWGAGIAKAFKERYPNAFTKYKASCKEKGADLLGTGLLLPPQKDDEHQHFVACLFTSRAKGKSKDSPKQILEATGPAMEDVLEQIVKWNSDHPAKDHIQEIRMCKINSGLFAVPWEDTKVELEKLYGRDGLPTHLLVITRPE